MYKLKEYRIWIDIKSRCCNSKNKRYKDYGKRGIVICDRWLNSFENFYEDMGPRPSNKYSIDRKDNNGNYCKENCRWATRDEQCSNRRTNQLITYNGITQTRTKWAKEIGISANSLKRRILNGWTTEQALTVKTGEQNKRANFIEYNGIRDSMHGWERRLGFKKNIITQRLKSGWSIERALTTPSRVKNEISS